MACGDDVMDAVEGPGISLQCDRIRKSSRSCPYRSAASLVETVLMPLEEEKACGDGDTHPKRKRNKAPPYMAQTTAWSRRCW